MCVDLALFVFACREAPHYLVRPYLTIKVSFLVKNKSHSLIFAHKNGRESTDKGYDTKTKGCYPK